MILIVLFIEHLQIVIDEPIQIFHPFPQGRDLYLKSIQAKIQIRPKRPTLHHLFQISIGSSHNADVHLLLLLTANRNEFLVLNKIQQLCLQIIRDLRDFIQE